MKSKVYFFIGTKAQAIKCLPVIKYFVDKLEIEIIDSGQHRKIVDEIYTSLNLNIEKNILSNNKNNISKENNINTLRYYGIGAQIIKDLKVRNMILVSRSKKKIIGLDGFGLKIKKQIIIK